MAPLPRHIALINQKGGVGKTTTTANLAAGLARLGRRVLLIDMDPQAHLTMHFGIDPAEDRQATIYDVLADGTLLAEAVRQTNIANLRIAPANIDLAAAEVELVGVVGREVLLRDALTAYADDEANAYDYLLLDCPPSLGLLTLNALSAAGEVIICLQPHFLALQGVGKLLETVSLVQQRINRSLAVSGVVLCMYDLGTRLAGEVTEDLAGFLAENRGKQTPWSAARIFQTVIRRNIKLAECPSFGQVIFEYAPGSHGAEDYARLAGEVVAMEPGGEDVSPETISQPMADERHSEPAGGSTSSPENEPVEAGLQPESAAQHTDQAVSAGQEQVAGHGWPDSASHAQAAPHADVAEAVSECHDAQPQGPTGDCPSADEATTGVS